MKALFYVFILVSLFGCKNEFESPYGVEYFNDSTLSFKDGTVKDSSKFYFPSDLMKISFGDSKTTIDSFRLKWFSNVYLCFREPLLYNYYLGCEKYRLLWLRSFDRSVLITIQKSNPILINTKILKSQPQTSSIIYKDGDWVAGSFETDIVKLRIEFPDADSIIVPKFNDPTLYDTTYALSKRQWNQFKDLLDTCNFWRQESTDDRFGLDGSDWILEGQSENKYHFVVRWSPKDYFEKCCEFLIKLSVAKDEKIY